MRAGFCNFHRFRRSSRPLRKAPAAPSACAAPHEWPRMRAPMSDEKAARLSHADLLQLKRWNTPTIYNGWEQITARDAATDAFNLDEVRDFMPLMGPMVGYAITVAFEPSKKAHRDTNPNAW